VIHVNGNESGTSTAPKSTVSGILSTYTTAPSGPVSERTFERGSGITASWNVQGDVVNRAVSVTNDRVNAAPRGSGDDANRLD
jgi:hypothetical protein